MFLDRLYSDHCLTLGRAIYEMTTYQFAVPIEELKVFLRILGVLDNLTVEKS